MFFSFLVNGMCGCVRLLSGGISWLLQYMLKSLLKCAYMCAAFNHVHELFFFCSCVCRSARIFASPTWALTGSRWSRLTEKLPVVSLAEPNRQTRLPLPPCSSALTPLPRSSMFLTLISFSPSPLARSFFFPFF